MCRSAGAKACRGGWPVIFGALVALGKGIAGMGGIGAGLYAFLNRLLIPTGLHHALNNVFWFDTIGLGNIPYAPIATEIPFEQIKPVKP